MDHRGPQTTPAYPPIDREKKEWITSDHFSKDQLASGKPQENLEKLCAMEFDGSERLMLIVTSMCEHLPEYRDRVKDLQDRLQSISDQDQKTMESVLQTIFDLREVQYKQESIIREVLGRTRNEAVKLVGQIAETANASIDTLGKLGVDAKDVKGQVEQWSSNSDSDLLSRMQSALQLLTVMEGRKQDSLPVRV